MDECTARIVRRSYRQVWRRAKPVLTQPLAEEIVDRIVRGEDDPRLEWLKGRKRVRVYLARSFPPSLYKQTTQGRTRRLRKKLNELLRPLGWVEVGRPNRVVFAKKKPRDE